MKWLVLILCIARYAEGGALRICEDASCSNEEFFEERPVVISTDGEKETVISEAECLPRSEWESNCHLCHCNEYGLARCTRMETCLQGEYAVPLRCKPNTTFTRDCNTCECLESGLDHCTLEDCHQSTMPKRSELVAGKECAPGTFWRSQCNECGCSPKGYPFCTEKACIGPESFEPEMRCAPDTMWLNECNTCWCITSGRAMCTLMGCVSETLYHAESPEIKVEPEGDKIEVSQKETETQNKQTEPDFEKEEEDTSKEIVEDKESAEVNSDHSIEELDYALMDFDRNLQDATIYEDNSNHLEDIDTIKDITHNVLKRSVCKPNQEFLLECNPCKCAPDGQSYTCTQNECMEGEKNKEVEVFMESEGIDHVEKHSVCKPRDTFYIGCNICHCNQFGTDYSCTNKPCPLPKDVEIFHELKDMKPIIPYIDEDAPYRNSSQKAQIHARI